MGLGRKEKNDDFHKHTDKTTVTMQKRMLNFHKHLYDNRVTKMVFKYISGLKVTME